MTNAAGDSIACYYCGSSIRAERPGRLDECANCGKYLHACRMCSFYDPKETSKQCREDDAEQVNDKQAANFCDYFRLRAGAFDAAAKRANDAARSQLDALFTDSPAAPSTAQDETNHETSLLQDAEALFRK